MSWNAAGGGWRWLAGEERYPNEQALMGSEKKCLKDDRFLYLDGFLVCFRLLDERVLGRECAVGPCANYWNVSSEADGK